MQTVKTKEELRSLISTYKHQGKIIGLVATMGYLHTGHTSLMQLAHTQCDVVVVSIFVNPLQFGVNDDLDKYPQDILGDTALCQENKVDILYIPAAQDILGANLQPRAYVNITQLDTNLCGKARPGHFKGVCTIVSKLFNLVTPDRAYFGKKDIQQLRIIEQMVADLDFPLQIVGGDTYRDKDGLALSSRNSYLTDEERQIAVIVPKTLELIRQLINSGIMDTTKLIKQAETSIQQANIPQAKLDYIEIVDDRLLQKVDKITGPVIIAIALFIGKTRLIDNIII